MNTSAQPQEVQTLLEENKVLQRYLEMINELYWAGQEIASADNLLYALNQLLYKVMLVVGAKDGSISRLDESIDEMVFVLVHGKLGRQLPDFRLKKDVGLAGWVARHGQPIIVNNPHDDPRFSDIIDKEFDFFTDCIVSVPIMLRGKIKGVIQMLNKHGNEFTEADVILLLILGQVAAIVFEEVEARRSSGEMSEEDPFAPL